jgi:exodeoxyribonuclease V
MTNPTMLSFLPFSANAQQVTVLNAIEQFLSNQDDFLVLKGAAGTGKTSIMKAVVDFLGSQEKSVQLLAPMGRSAKAISNKTQTTAKTVHSCIYKPSTDTENAVVNLIRRVNDITQKQVFIIDESSMLSNKLTDNEDFVSQKPLLTDLIHFIKQGNSRNKIIFVGDDCQLAPIGYASYEKSPALNVQYLEKTFAIRGKEVALSQVMRQVEGSAIYQTANEIRQNIYGNRAVMPNYIGNYFKGEDEAVKLYLNRFELGKQDKVVIIGCSNAYADKCNALIRRNLGLTGTLSVGDTVMLNQNYMGQRYVASGEIGVVKSINSRIRKVADLDFVDAEIMFTDEKNQPFTIVTKVLLNTLVGKIDKEQKKNLYASAMRNNPAFRNSKDSRDDEYLSALQLSYGHAINGYKAQGSEWDTVILNTWFPPNNLRFLYTGVTRARKELFGNTAYKIPRSA